MADKLARAKLARAAARFGAGSGSALSSLILMTDDRRLSDPFGAARALPPGSMVIVRARDAARRAQLAAGLRGRNFKLLIANDAELASRMGADGIHLSEARADEAAHWRARRPDWIITVAAHSLRACHRARHADAILLSPVFATASHPEVAALGAIRLRLMARQCRLPLYALGGIDAGRVGRLAGAPLAGLAAIGALSADMST